MTDAAKPSPEPSEPDDEPVVKLPRGRGMRLRGPDLFRIAFTVIMLIAVIVFAKPCGDAVGTFFSKFDNGSGSGSAGSGSAGSATGSGRREYLHLTPDMTEQQTKDAIEKYRAEHATGSDSGH